MLSSISWITRGAPITASRGRQDKKIGTARPQSRNVQLGPAFCCIPDRSKRKGCAHYPGSSYRPTPLSFVIDDVVVICPTCSHFVHALPFAAAARARAQEPETLTCQQSRPSIDTSAVTMDLALQRPFWLDAAKLAVLAATC